MKKDKIMLENRIAKLKAKDPVANRNLINKLYRKLRNTI